MSSLTPEQIVAAQKAGVDTTFGLLNKAFAGVVKLVELNMQAAKSTLAENQEILAKGFSAGAPQALFTQQGSQVQPAIEKAQSYWRLVYEITSGTQAEFAAVAEAQLKQYQLDAQIFVDSLVKNAPAGSETAVAALKTFITTTSATANKAYETARKAARQAVELAENNINAASPASTKRTRQLPAPVEAAEK
ncbi:TIGR01841 family phasin [Paraburkholderia sp. BL10I2N1]|uniref:TIGR01841 family phasin n=1 Tax=Paraburkholderia sp. BL10I2N1 TaxID=1938796 RepID=UPI00105C6957|nr:TIGR01841 family phasin [Paraburkholderia sp. BL10I2N1]TDN68856.1 phasin family protein [Paraburkholderia sp. BL10I2N1]